MTNIRRRNPSAKSFAGLCLALFLVACGESPPTETAPPPRSRVETPSPPAAAPVSAKTRETYQWYCTQCHGVKGKGDGINAPWVTVPPRNHTKADYLETRSDRELFETIKFGGLAMGRAPCMPAWGHTLDDDMIHSLVRYIRELCHCEAI
ncbi:MAG: c-type cytochrome [Nitrospinales bacterium]